MYHNVVPTRDSVEGDRSLHLARPDFAKQLDYLQAACDVVPLRELIDGELEDPSRFRVALTFDDAYLGAVSVGLDEVTRRGLPATIFAPPGLLGQETWWDVLAAASPDGMNGDDRARLLQEFRGQAEAIRHSPQWAGARRDSPLQPELRIAEAAELAQAVSQPRITIGSHTWTHPNLAAIDPEMLDDELRRSFEWLRERFSSFVPFVTYPYGLSSPRVQEAAARAGYRAGFGIGGGWLPRDTAAHRFALPRFDVSSGLSLDGLRLRLGGFGLG